MAIAQRAHFASMITVTNVNVCWCGFFSPKTLRKHSKFRSLQTPDASQPANVSLPSRKYAFRRPARKSKYKTVLIIKKIGSLQQQQDEATKLKLILHQANLNAYFNRPFISHFRSSFIFSYSFFLLIACLFSSV